MHKHQSIIPGFNITFGITVLYISIIVIVPLGSLFFKAAELNYPQFFSIITSPRIKAAYFLTLNSAFIAAVINLILGLVLSWVLVRYDFFGKKIIDAMIDLPFALPTSIAGITLATIYSTDYYIGRLFNYFGIKIAYTQIGIIIALIFVGLPFVVRTIESTLRDLQPELEEAAYCLGATNWQIFLLIILPNLIPAIITGFSLALARGIAEYGSVIFIAGNIPKISEIIPLIIAMKIEQFDYQAASLIAIIMLFTSFLLLLLINFAQHYSASFTKK